MRNPLRTSLLALLLLSNIFVLKGQMLTAYFDYKVFKIPGEGHLLETYVNINGPSAAFIAVDDSTDQAEIELKLIVTKGQGIKDFKKEAIKSPLAVKGYRPDFLSTHRFLLPKGYYELEIEMKDVNRPDDPPLQLKRKLDLTESTTELGFSDIELLAGFKKAEAGSTLSKSGLDMLPLMTTVFGQEFNELIFYAELYNMDRKLEEQTPFLLRYYLEDADFERLQPSTEVNKRKRSSKVLSEMAHMDISQVPSGRYNLIIEARDRDNQLLTSNSLSIFRVNPGVEKSLSQEEIDLTFVGSMNDKDSLLAFIYSLRPIAEDKDRLVIDHQVADFTFIQCKSFFYSFWENRSPLAPDQAWAEYKKNVELVDDRFGTSNREGYETDMGRVYLVYGAPNSVANETNDPQTYPFQIWHYYKAGKFNDKRFVFYDRELLQREYTLLHSDVPGEVRNPRWDIILQSRTTPTWNTDQQQAGGSGSERLQQLYESPR